MASTDISTGSEGSGAERPVNDDVDVESADSYVIDPKDMIEAKKDRHWFIAAPWYVKLCILWLAFVVIGAIWAKVDINLLDDALPLQDPTDQPFQLDPKGPQQPRMSPSVDHFLGTDSLSRDMFARVVHGGWTSLVVALTAAAFGVIVGGLIGSFVGYVRGKTETVIMAGIDVILAFPALILLLAMIAIYQVRSLTAISLVIGILSIPVYTRIARANTLAVSSREFVHAAQAMGTSRWRILFREIIPNVLPVLLAYAMVQAAFVIVIEGTLSFLGLSVQPPEPTWGNMIIENRADIRQRIAGVFWPSLWMTLTVLSLNQIGDWLQQKSSVRASAL